MLSRVIKLKKLALFLLIGCAVSFSGCSFFSSGDFRDPSVQLVKVDLIKAKLLQQEFVLYFCVDNPNNFSLELSELNYKVFLNDVPLATGQSYASLNVPGHGQKTLRVPVRTNLWRHLKQVVRMLEKPDKPIPYRFEGEVHVGSFFGRNVQLLRNGEIIPGDYIPE